MKNVAFRPARLDDVGALESLDQRIWNEINTPEDLQMRPRFGSRRRLEDTWVAETGSEPVGFFSLGQRTQFESNRHVAVLRVLAVAPEYQRQGIGTSLLRLAIAEAARRNCRKLSLTVLSSNAPAVRLYEQAGFVIEGCLREEYFLNGHWIDDLIMARFLAATDVG